MSIQVKEFNQEKALEELKKCPKIVQDYVKLLTKHKIAWEEIATKAINNLKKQSIGK